MWKLFRYIKPYWKYAVLAPLLMLVEVGMDLLQPKLVAKIINEGVLNQNLAIVQRVGAMLIGAAFIGVIGGVGCTIFASIASQSFGTDLRSDLFKKVQSFSFSNLDQFKTGSLVTRLTNDVVQMQNVVMTMLRILVRAPMLAVGSLIMAFTISTKLAIILIVAIPLLFAALYFVIEKGFPLFSKVQKKLDQVNTVLQENLAGIRVVRAFVRENFEKKRFGRANDELMDVSIKSFRVMALIMPVMMLLMNGSIVAVLWLGGLQTWEGSLLIGDLVAFINYVTQVLFSLMMVGMLLVMISRAKASAQRINQVMDTEPEIKNRQGAEKTSLSLGRIVFENVSFAYDPEEGDYALKNISFTAEPGQTIAILGATGSGKSTLVHLIPRLYDPTEGRIMIDGTDIKDIDINTLRSNIGMVLQDTILFSGTICDNIRFGKPSASQQEVEAAAKIAQAHDFIIKMPKGYNTPLGQRGVNLSGGQKQRIAIARALLIRPSILILDDSTSAVDLGTESRIQKALKAQMKKSTTIIIAQRISSVLEADKIIVLDEGSIVGIGTHDQLINNNAVYRDIYRSQITEGEVVNA